MLRKMIKDFLLSFTHYRPIGPLLFVCQVLFLFYLAQAIGLDLFDLRFDSYFTKELTGARFITRVLQIYLLKITLKRVMDILDYHNLGVKHILIISIVLFGPVWIGKEPILLLVLPFIPGNSFYLRELKRIKLYYNLV